MAGRPRGAARPASRMLAVWPPPADTFGVRDAASSQPPGPLLGVGRSADVYALGQDRVLRRFRADFDVRPEAQIMIHLGQAGFPVPRVYLAEGRDLVLERLDGPDMLADLSRRPWLVRQHARTLARLHDGLHEIEAPSGLRGAFGPGNRVLHLDLHPGNVMLTARGPVVIDWTNARAGAPGADVAMAYLIMASSDVDSSPWWLRPAIRPLRAMLLREFRAAVRDDPGSHIPWVARERIADPNVRPAEADRLRRLAQQVQRS
jgi:aminoglycoside phosphotransferase (APT) family kinase protein